MTIHILEKGDPETVKSSVACKALVRIGTIYKLEGALKWLSPDERLKKRQASIKPLMEEYFVWIKEVFR